MISSMSGKLEVHVGQAQPQEAVEVEAGVVNVPAKGVAQQHGQKADLTQRGDKGKGQRHAGKVGRHARQRSA
jgi:hypothetical protein